MKAAQLCLVGLIVLLAQQAICKESATAYNRWAIISSPEVVKSGLPDLVMLEVGKIPGIEVIDYPRKSVLSVVYSFLPIHSFR